MLSNPTRFFLTSIYAVFLVTSCAHNKVQPVSMPETASPSAEVDSLAADIEAAKAQDYEVLAPENFKRAEKNLKEAQEQRAKGKSGEHILKSVGYGRAYLNRAQAAAQNSQEQLSDVIKAREKAILAGADQFPSDKKSLDNDLKNYTKRIENNKNIDRSDITELQADYLDLELKAIKNTKLSEARNTLESAKKQGAKRLVPSAYQQAEEKITVAENVIETERHNTQAINQATYEAVNSAQRALTLAETANANKGRSPEEIAQEIENRNRQLDQADALNSAARAEAASSRQQLAAQSSHLTNLEKQRRELASKEQFNKAFEAARAEFSEDEAEVYRQGDNMIIRLKAMKFPTGRADLPTSSMPILNKVKKVIGQLPAENIVIEGHTDSTGTAALNKELSAKRASAVANYFTSENAISPENIESIGYGYDKPIATNKNRVGRELNRRVDVVIKPTHAASSPSQPAPSEEDLSLE